MKPLRKTLTTIWQFIFQPTPEQREADQEGWIFYLVITFLLIAVSLLAVFERLILGSPTRFVVYIALLSVHIALHWISGRIMALPQWRLAYSVLQGALGLCVIWLAESPELTLAIFSALIGEAIGIFGITRQVWGIIVGYILLIATTYYLNGGLETLAAWSSPTISTVILLIIFMVLYRKQIEARERTQEVLAELENAHYQLSEYATQVEDLTLTTERQRMARELHDTLAQGLSGLVMQLEAIRHHLGKLNTDRVEIIVRQALVSARSTLADSRAAINNLRSTPANLLEDIRIRVRFIFHDKQLELEVRDNGQGFQPENAILAGHYGILGMRERARLMNGVLVIESQVGQGTRINLKIHLNLEGLL